MRNIKVIEFVKGLYENAISKHVHDTIIASYETRLAELRAQNNELWQKLMAKDLPEYVTFKDDATLDGTPTEYDFTKDEDLAGEVIDETNS